MASLFALAFGAEVAFVAASSLEVFADTAAAVDSLAVAAGSLEEQPAADIAVAASVADYSAALSPLSVIDNLS